MSLSSTVGTRYRKRHPDRPDLLLHWEDKYQNLDVQSQQGALITNFLKATYRVMSHARNNCSRTLAIRMDLHYSAKMQPSAIHTCNIVMSNFLYYLRRELDNAQIKYPHAMRYVWCREQNSSSKPHYHLLLLLNGNAYRSIGDMRQSVGGGYFGQNLFHRIMRAWSQAIGWPIYDSQGLVYIAREPTSGQCQTYHFHRDDEMTFARVFHDASYMCKAHTKPIAQGIHCFEGSRR